MESAALAFVRASNPLDEVFVLNSADTPRIDVPFTKDVSSLEAGLARVDSIGGTALRDAVLMGERYIHDHATCDRRALLVITDGNDNASTIAKAQLRKVVDQSGTAIFAVSLTREQPADRRRNDDELEHLAEITGGTVQDVASLAGVTRVVLDIAHRMRNQYTIAYAPSNQLLDGSYRTVRVKVTRPGGLTARTRPRYWATPLPPIP